MAVATLRKLERNAFCRLCATILDKGDDAIEWRSEQSGHPQIILCLQCIGDLTKMVQDYEKQRLPDPCLTDQSPNTWAVLDSNLPSTVALYLELEHSQTPTSQSHSLHCWVSIYRFEDETYRVTLRGDDKWMVEVLK